MKVDATWESVWAIDSLAVWIDVVVMVERGGVERGGRCGRVRRRLASWSGSCCVRVSECVSAYRGCEAALSTDLPSKREVAKGQCVGVSDRPK